MKKILIFGSCVSRDALEYAKQGEFELVGYYARSSLASLISPPFIDNEILDKIGSKFKKRMVAADMSKSFWSILNDIEFDILLVDFIDERFKCVHTLEGGIHTISSEYKAVASSFTGKIITSGSESHLSLWRKGFEKLVGILRKRNLLNKLKISRVYWTNCVSDGGSIHPYTEEQVKNANKTLFNMYSIVSEMLGTKVFIDYSAEQLIIDADHKLGVSPFHYIRGFYLQTLTELSELNSERLFDGHGYVDQPSQFRSKNWNVVCPIDNFGEKSFGSWFLGEKGNLFWLKIMPKIIAEVRERTGNGRLYFWGSSMGGYAAIVHGRLNMATAIYANVPQTYLLGSKYANGGMKQYFSPIFGKEVINKYNDLKELFDTRSRTKYFLCFNQLESNGYLEEQCLAFVAHLQTLRQKFYLEIRPLDTHGKNHGVSEAIALFKKYQD